MLLELLFELVFQLVFEVLGEAAFHGAGKVLGSRRGRLATSAVAGAAAGAAWGLILAGRGLETVPRTVWASLLLAVVGVGAGLALRNAAAARGEDADTVLRAGFVPWRWSPHQWDAFALLNVFVAAGCALGFTLA